MKDLKYLAAYTIPLTAIIGLIYKNHWCYLTPLYSFVFIPLIEYILPEENSNLSKEEGVVKSINPIFDWMLYLNLPIVYGVLIFALKDISSNALSNYEFIGLIFTVGIVLATNGINVGHELGHRSNSKIKFLGKILLLPSLYMHFFIEHNFGHHLHAATKEDPATAKYNQTVYSFWFTSVIGQYISAWKIQIKLLKNNNHAFFSYKNDMFWYVVIQSVYLILIYILFNKTGLLFAVGAAVTSFVMLETVNYIEHYGLMRLKTTHGRYERIRVIHSWNSNHIIGRIVLYELTRHSDHHYKTTKKYQILECHEESPQMPYGYTTSMAITLIPPLWFNIMNKRIPKEMIYK